MRGRKPLPTTIRILRNNPGKRRINRDEPQSEQLAVACPDEIGDTIAQQEWRRTIVPAIERRQIASADVVMAVAHCELWATWRSQLAEASKHPHVVAVGPNKHPVPNPARGMANKTFQLLAKVDAELGLTPSSRSRVVGGQSGSGRTTSKLDKFRAQKARTA